MLIKNPTYRPDALPLGAVILSPEFQALNPLQRKFIVQYIDRACASGTYNAVDAVQHTYGLTTKNVELRAYQILRTRKVKKVLDLHFRRSVLDSILSDLKRSARKSVKLKVGLTPATEKALAAFEAYVAAKENKSWAEPVSEIL